MSLGLNLDCKVHYAGSTADTWNICSELRTSQQCFKELLPTARVCWYRAFWTSKGWLLSRSCWQRLSGCGWFASHHTPSSSASPGTFSLVDSWSLVENYLKAIILPKTTLEIWKASEQLYLRNTAGLNMFMITYMGLASHNKLSRAQPSVARELQHSPRWCRQLNPIYLC